MQWIEALTHCTDSTATATVRFTSAHFAVTKGKVPETALIECMAQTVAAAAGERSKLSAQNGQGTATRSGHGVLAAVSNFRIHSLVPLNQSLLITVRELKRFGPMLLVSGVISNEQGVIAEGELSLHG
jgi:predicted hotdog family 3-hydroxylacyl-ACP dehydratase